MTVYYNVNGAPKTGTTDAAGKVQISADTYNSDVTVQITRTEITKFDLSLVLGEGVVLPSGITGVKINSAKDTLAVAGESVTLELEGTGATGNWDITFTVTNGVTDDPDGKVTTSSSATVSAGTITPNNNGAVVITITGVSSAV